MASPEKHERLFNRDAYVHHDVMESLPEDGGSCAGLLEIFAEAKRIAETSTFFTSMIWPDGEEIADHLAACQTCNIALMCLTCGAAPHQHTDSAHTANYVQG